MDYDVRISAGAERDLEETVDYIAEHDAPAKAGHVLSQVMRVAESLAHSPERGAYPPEMLKLGIWEFRRTSFKPYRLIYRVVGSQLIVLMIADGRRNMQALLQRRLLGA